MGNKKSRAEITEDQKRRAIHLKNQGWLNRNVARDTGILEGTIANCWKRWAQELGVQIITREESCEKAESMPVTVSYVEPLPPLVKKAAPVRPETPSVLESVIRSTRKEAAAVGTVESADSMVIEASEGDRTTEVIEEAANEPEAAQEVKEVQEDVEAAPVGTKKSTAPERRARRAGRPAAAAEAAAKPNGSELQRIYDLIGLINEAVVDYAIEMMVLPEQIGQSVEICDGIMCMTLTVPVGGGQDV